MKKRLHFTIESILIQAQKSLEDVFDIPTPQIVAAFLNMNHCMALLLRFEDAYRYYSQGALMALALQMDRDDPVAGDPIELEFRRRIWALVCQREMLFRFGFDKPMLISLDIILQSPKPTATANYTESYKLKLVSFMLRIHFYCKLLELRNIDWSLPDVHIIQQLASIVAFLQSDHSETLQYCGGKDEYELSETHCSFWSDWCNLWRQFIESDAPPGRLETDLMRQMRVKALEEFLKIRRQIFRELVQMLELLRLFANKAIIEQWLACQIVSTLEELKPAVFTKEELEKVGLPILRRIAIKPNKQIKPVNSRYSL
ncbi:uncharacterized protein VTP21DRAFT_5651 [Calcarisporiella thermophila]|uniref:uncharacterized protein n=1 Tax=Calcarisporiella thermophila TaxID=911321 RepID=UPI0037426BD7